MCDVRRLPFPHSQHLGRRHPYGPLSTAWQVGQVKAKLQGIDVPERNHPFGERSQQALAERPFQKKTELRCTNTDRCKRQVCSV